MKITHDKVMVEVIEVKERTMGSIYVPTGVGLVIKKGKVIAHGPGRHNEMGTVNPVEVKVGDIVVFAQHAGLPIEYLKGGKEVKYLVLPEIEILGILADDEE